MATYGGYNLKINNVTVPNNVIKIGTYVHTPEKRVRSERVDANGIHHKKFYSTLRHKITFTIKAGTKDEYDTIKSALATRNNVTVKFWDEDSADYLTGTFDITAPAWAHSYENSTTYYFAETPIELIQH